MNRRIDGCLDLKNELDGRVNTFGRKLLERLNDKVSGQLLEGDADITTLIYRDRYLNSPLPVALLLDFIGAIKDMHLKRWDNPAIEIVSVAVPEDSRNFAPPSQVFHNWQSTTVRDKAIQAGFERRGMNAVVRSPPKPLASHARFLEICISDGRELKLWLDQGYGYCSSPRLGTRAAQTASTWFGFNELPSWQGEELSQGRYVIEGQSFPTYIFFREKLRTTCLAALKPLRSGFYCRRGLFSVWCLGHFKNRHILRENLSDSVRCRWA